MGKVSNVNFKNFLFIVAKLKKHKVREFLSEKVVNEMMLVFETMQWCDLL